MWKCLCSVIVMSVVAVSGGCLFSGGGDEVSDVVATDAGDRHEGVPDVGSREVGDGVRQEYAHPCPPMLAECYDLFPAGNECEPGILIARFTHTAPGGVEQCAGTSDGEQGLDGCVFYGGAITGLAYCCNGYIANRANVIVDTGTPECCADALSGPGEEAEFFTGLGHDGVYDPGLDVSQWLPDVTQSEVVCAEMYYANGAQSNEYLNESDGAYVMFYPASVTQEGDLRILRCAYKSPPVNQQPVPLQNLGLIPESDWPPGGGAECYFVQEDAYPW